MRHYRAVLIGLGAAAVLAAAFLAPWSPRPLLVYESVTGYPMKVYFRNIGDSPVAVTGAAGLPALSDEPLPPEKIAAYFETVRSAVRPSKSLIKSGEFVWFIAEDPDGLAWVPAKTEHTTYLYLFGLVESPRAALVNDKWVHQLCLVSKTNEPFRPCETHNDVYAGS